MRSIVITSGKGGVGKTTLVATLGRMLGLMGFRVLLIDTDMGLNNLDVALNLEKKVVFDVLDVLSGRCRLRQALLEDVVGGVYILPSNHGYDASAMTGDSLKRLITTSLGFDFCLVDCPAGIETGFHRAVTACEEAIVVTTPHISALKDADKVVSILRSYGTKTYMALNRVRGDLIVSLDMLSPEDLRAVLKAPLIGVIPENDDMSIYSNTGRLLPEKNEGYKAAMIMAKNLLYDTEMLYDVTKGFKGIFGKLKRAAKRHK